jgi:hypothetical protein
LDTLDEMPQALPHGDASPQNLLIPRGARDQLVAIDIAFQCPLAIGFDLGQLLIGLVHAGQMPAARLPEVDDVLVPSFVEGMKEHGCDVPRDQVEYSYLGTCSPGRGSPRCRSSFSAPRSHPHSRRSFANVPR